MASEMAAAWVESGQSPAVRKGSVRPVDLVHLSRYTLGERELEREVLELFCTQSLLYLERLKTAQSDKDWKDAAHSLKGSARAIGAWRTAEAAERAEALSGEDLASSRALSLRDVESSLAEAETYIGSLLKDR
ncbi:MAG TPA: Hpt domain-containing protein [Rhizobiales bacterium]|jgi:HPt (histidine-containing phosphotransfer) domain-containing protein|nr:Hpt domain-containing protein [Hyphomicrobiales bacterium]HBH42303.1 Hpt domain-containing protein [Hyphomicrobiales bacterium]